MPAGGRTIHFPWTLYKVFNSTGDLLYVGIAGSALERMAQHARKAAWYGEAAAVTLIHYSTRIDAETAEYEAILLDQPRYNIFRNKYPIR